MRFIGFTFAALAVMFGAYAVWTGLFAQGIVNMNDPERVAVQKAAWQDDVVTVVNALGSQEQAPPFEAALAVLDVRVIDERGTVYLLGLEALKTSAAGMLAWEDMGQLSGEEGQGDRYIVLDGWSQPLLAAVPTSTANPASLRAELERRTQAAEVLLQNVRTDAAFRGMYSPTQLGVLENNIVAPMLNAAQAALDRPMSAVAEASSDPSDLINALTILARDYDEGVAALQHDLMNLDWARDQAVVYREAEAIRRGAATVLSTYAVQMGSLRDSLPDHVQPLFDSYQPPVVPDTLSRTSIAQYWFGASPEGRLAFFQVGGVLLAGLFALILLLWGIELAFNAWRERRRHRRSDETLNRLEAVAERIEAVTHPAVAAAGAGDAGSDAWQKSPIGSDTLTTPGNAQGGLARDPKTGRFLPAKKPTGKGVPSRSAE